MTKSFEERKNGFELLLKLMTNHQHDIVTRALLSLMGMYLLQENEKEYEECFHALDAHLAETHMPSSWLAHIEWDVIGKSKQ